MISLGRAINDQQELGACKVHNRASLQFALVIIFMIDNCFCDHSYVWQLFLWPFSYLIWINWNIPLLMIGGGMNEKSHSTDNLNVTSRAQVYRKVIALKRVSPVPAEKPTRQNKQKPMTSRAQMYRRRLLFSTNEFLQPKSQLIKTSKWIGTKSENTIQNV